MRCQPTASHHIAGKPFEDPTGGSMNSAYPATGEAIAKLHAASDATVEVICRANATPFGLAAGPFTRKIARAHRVVALLDAGTTWINTYNPTPVEMPFGGAMQSGLGRENGRAALDAMTRVKSIYVEAGDVWAPY